GLELRPDAQGFPQLHPARMSRKLDLRGLTAPQVEELGARGASQGEAFLPRDQRLRNVGIEDDPKLRDVFGQQMNVAQSRTGHVVRPRGGAELAISEGGRSTAVKNEPIAYFERAIAASIHQYVGIAERHHAKFVQVREVLAHLIARVTVDG